VIQPCRPYARASQELHTVLSSLISLLSFEVAFQVQRLAQNNCLSPITVLQLLDTVAAVLKRSRSGVTVAALRKFYNQIPFPSPMVDASDFELSSLIELLQETERTILKNTSTGLTTYNGTSENVAYIHRIKITPMSTYLSGPERESNNRILRKYPDNHDSFLRVQFTDEDGDKLHFNTEVSNFSVIHGRFKDIMEHGITIAGRTFHFPGFSNSSLRMQSCWFVASFIHDGAILRAPAIIAGLGAFENIFSPAKCAARIGQVFSDTRTAVHIDSENVDTMFPDIESGGYMFSDGIGTVSAALLDRIVSELPRARLALPTCLQIRYRGKLEHLVMGMLLISTGAKGMVSLDSTLQGEVLNIRKSMVKFEGSKLNDIEICDASYKPFPVFLNRQFIKIMEDMGVDDQWFMDLQDQEVNRLRLITDQPTNAASFLKRQGIGEHFAFPQLITGLEIVGLDFKGTLDHQSCLTLAFNVLYCIEHPTDAMFSI
jgi:hypothetical protein